VQSLPDAVACPFSAPDGFLDDLDLLVGQPVQDPAREVPVHVPLQHGVDGPDRLPSVGSVL
jgi:hypothetical protein